MNDLTLSWGKPKIKGKYQTADFFTKYFDKYAKIEFVKNEKINFIRIEKNGYYSEDINLSAIKSKNYSVIVQLRPKSEVESRDYISNERIKLRFSVDRIIYLNSDIGLKKELCR